MSTSLRTLAAELLPSALQGLQGLQRAAFAPRVEVVDAASFAALAVKLGYLSKADLKKVREAFKFADEAHLGQFRATGEPYITHPIANGSSTRRR
jgi:GTP diphosphokinase / guanosine-3',5'-bis(diphosphate) 3'-diphosphatase